MKNKAAIAKDWAASLTSRPPEASERSLGDDSRHHGISHRIGDLRTFLSPVNLAHDDIHLTVFLAFSRVL